MFVCLEKVNKLVVFGAMGTFGEHYPCTLTYHVAGRLHQDVILGMDWLQHEDPLIFWRDFMVTFSTVGFHGRCCWGGGALYACDGSNLTKK